MFVMTAVFRDAYLCANHAFGSDHARPLYNLRPSNDVKTTRAQLRKRRHVQKRNAERRKPNTQVEGKSGKTIVDVESTSPSENHATTPRTMPLRECHTRIINKHFKNKWEQINKRRSNLLLNVYL